MLEKKITTIKTFLIRDSIYFAKLSGDFNPVHLDKEFASKSIQGERVVHGINSVFWALNFFFEKKSGYSLSKINIDFKNPIYFKKKVFLDIEETSENIYNFSIYDKISKKVFFSIKVTKAKFRIRVLKTKGFRKPLVEEIDVEKHNNKDEKLDVRFNNKILQSDYVNLYRNVDHYILGALLKSSYIVGMKMPGKYSTFISLKAVVNSKSNYLRYSLDSFDKRFNLLTINIKGILNGSIHAIRTQRHVNIMPVNEIKRFLSKDLSYFKNKKILIIGGSRGLGAYMVKIFSLLDAEIKFSYFNNKKNAKDITNEIFIELKKRISSSKINVLKNDLNELKNFMPDLVFYMATPKIGKIKNNKIIDEDKLQTFYNYYINGFLNVYNFYSAENNNQVRYFYPSTNFITNKDLASSEYVIIKKLAEKICNILNNNASNKNKIFFPRIKPLLTDQHLIFYGNYRVSSPLKDILTLLKRMTKK